MAPFLIGCLVLFLRFTYLVLRFLAFFALLSARFAAGVLRWGAGRGPAGCLLSLVALGGISLYALAVAVSTLLRLKAWLGHLVGGVPHLLWSAPILHGPSWLMVALAVLGGLVLARVAITTWATSRTLETRQGWALVPTRSFNVTLPMVELAAGQLGHIQRRLFGWTDRRASALTIRLKAVEGGEMLYAWEAAARAGSVLGVAARVYHEVEMRPLDEEGGIDA